MQIPLFLPFVCSFACLHLSPTLKKRYAHQLFIGIFFPHILNAEMFSSCPAILVLLCLGHDVSLTTAHGLVQSETGSNSTPVALIMFLIAWPKEPLRIFNSSIPVYLL